MVKPNPVHLTVQTLSGTFEGDFESDEKLQTVIEKVLLTLDIKPAPGEVWMLQYRGSTLDPQSTIEENKLPNGAVLIYERQEGGGGTYQPLKARR